MKYVWMCALAVFATLNGYGQTCFEGNCENGYGKKDSPTNLYVGSFYNKLFDGSGMRISKENGAITIGYYSQGVSSFSIVEFVSGTLQFGTRKKKETTGLFYLHNGFEFTESAMAKYIDGRKYPLEFDFSSNACLIGDCEGGFGAEFLSFTTQQKDTLYYLYVGNYKGGDWDGEGGYYEFGSETYFVGKFLNGNEWTGGYFNHDDEQAIFLVDGQEVKTMSYTIPEFTAPASTTAAAPQQSAAKSAPSPQRGGFWKSLGVVAGEVLVGALDGAAKSQAAKKQPSGSTSSASKKYQVEMHIVNMTNRQIDELFVSSSNTDDWGDDILGDNVMGHGLGDVLSFSTSESTCFYDLRVHFNNGSTSTWTKLDVCTYNTFELMPNTVVRQRND